MTDNVIINNKNRGVLRLVMLGLLNMFFCFSKQKENKQKEEEIQKLAEVITDYSPAKLISPVFHLAGASGLK